MTTDNFGNWLNLGTITPSLNEWRVFPVSVWLISTYRISFNSTIWNYNLGWMWLRYLFYDGSTTLSQKIFPRQSPVIINYPIPPQFVNAGLIFPELEIKKGIRPYLGITNIINWEVTIEALVV